MNCPYCNSSLQNICTTNRDHVYVYTGVINILSFSMNEFVAIQITNMSGSYGLSILDKIENEDFEDTIKRVKGNPIISINEDCYNQIINSCKDKEKLSDIISKIVTFQ